MEREQAALAAGCVLAALLPAAAVLTGPASGGVTAATHSGGNGLIAFVSSRDGDDDVYVMEPDGDARRRVTTVDADNGAPAWSPDGADLVYEQDDGEGGSALWVRRVDDPAVRQLTDDGAEDTDPSWSPDGERIVFASDRGSDHSQLWVVDADGTDARVLLTTPTGSSASDPTWSPDGRRIAYTYNPGTEGEPSAIYAVDADGTGAAPVTTPTADEDDYHPDWSPDGARIVFTSDSDAGPAITTVRPDGTGEVRLTEPADRSTRPAWSPDGTAIAFVRSAGGGTSMVQTVWTMAADGSAPQRLTSDTATGDDTEPSWQPVVADELVVDPATEAHVVGDEVTVRATATDALGDPVAGAELVLLVTGAHPQTRRLTTGADGRATATWTGDRAGTDAVLVCADPDGNGACEPESPAGTASVMWSVAQDPRLAFTDDADALYRLEIQRFVDETDTLRYGADDGFSFGTDLVDFEAGPTHEGEAAGVPGDQPAFVSTRDDPNGEVYLAQIRDQPPRRVTCDPGTETHPVVNTFGWVAYASDADGDWDIYLSAPPPLEVPGRVAPFGRSALPAAPSTPEATLATACQAGWTTVNVTQEPLGAPPADDLWPTWSFSRTTQGDASGVDPTGLVFSRAAAGELPDLYLAPVAGNAFTSPTASPAVALTTTPDVAETQPAGMALRVRDNPGCAPECTPTFAVRSWVAFATTEYRSSGSLALLSPDAPALLVYPQDPDASATEPAWSDVVNPTHLAVTSTETDPYGDIAIAEVDGPVLAGTVPADPVVGELLPLGHGPTGVGESHPHWLSGFGIEGDTATLVVTSRSTDWVRSGRLLDADVSDVFAPDGSQRRVLRREEVAGGPDDAYRFDEAGPSYSPDGRRFVYSRDVGPTDETTSSRLLVVADADGTNAAPLLPATLRQPTDLDVDPVWSPDGRRIAFVRLTDREPEATRAPPEVHVYDLVAGTITRIPGSDDEEPSADLAPSWAPDSRHLVLTRSDSGVVGPADAARRWDSGPRRYTPELVVVDADAPLEPAVRFDFCDDGCDLRGRTPAWSPDGTTIAFELDGQLQTAVLDAPCCTPAPGESSLVVAPPTSLVGLGTSTDEPTPSRAVIARAQDPAWSPDGSELAFSGQPVGQPDHTGIWRIGADGTDLRPFTDEPGPESEPAWQPRPSADVAVTVTVTGSPAMIDDPVRATFTVTNNGPRPAPLVSLDTTFAAGAVTNAPGAPAGCRGNGTGCDLPVLAPGASVVYPVRVRHGARVLGVATGMVTADAPDPDLTNNTATAPYRVMGADVAVQVDLDSPDGYVGGRRLARVTVRNLGVDPVEDVQVRATWPAEVAPTVPVPALPPPAAQPAPDCLVQGLACALGTIDAGGRRAFLVDLRTPTAGVVLLAAEVSTSTMEVDLTNNEDEVLLEVLQPELRLLPGVAPPGKVVLAYGERFPPGSRVILRWRPGITVLRGSLRVAADGTLRMPLLVVRHDLLGERELVAFSTSALFRAVTGDLLVVPRTLSPPSFNGRG